MPMSLSMSTLHIHVYAACPSTPCMYFLCCSPFVYAACPCPCWMFNSMLHGHGHAVGIRTSRIDMDMDLDKTWI
jgi:hypothetical protein